MKKTIIILSVLLTVLTSCQSIEDMDIRTNVSNLNISDFKIFVYPAYQMEKQVEDGLIPGELYTLFIFAEMPDGYIYEKISYDPLKIVSPDNSISSIYKTNNQIFFQTAEGFDMFSLEITFRRQNGLADRDNVMLSETSSVIKEFTWSSETEIVSKSEQEIILWPKAGYRHRDGHFGLPMNEDISFNLYSLFDSHKVKRITDLSNILILNTEGSCSVSIYEKHLDIQFEDDYLGYALGQDTNSIELSQDGSRLNQIWPAYLNWRIDGSGANGQDGESGYVQYDWDGNVESYRINGEDGENGGTGKTFYFDAAVYDDGQNEPFFILFDRSAGNIYTTRSEPIIVLANGGSGGAGGAGLTVTEDMPSYLEDGIGGNGGDGGKGGNVYINIPKGLDINEFVKIANYGGNNGDSGSGGVDYQSAAWFFDALFALDSGESGDYGNWGIVEITEVNDMALLFTELKDERFNRQFLTNRMNSFQD